MDIPPICTAVRRRLQQHGSLHRAACRSQTRSFQTCSTHSRASQVVLTGLVAHVAFSLLCLMSLGQWRQWQPASLHVVWGHLQAGFVASLPSTPLRGWERAGDTKASHHPLLHVSQQMRHTRSLLRVLHKLSDLGWRGLRWVCMLHVRMQKQDQSARWCLDAHCIPCICADSLKLMGPFAELSGWQAMLKSEKQAVSMCLARVGQQRATRPGT